MAPTVPDALPGRVGMGENFPNLINRRITSYYERSAQPIEINEEKYEVYVSANEFIDERLGCSLAPRT